MGRFESRPVAEEQPAWKQPIPYCGVRCGDDVFVVQRRKGGTEQRLHGKKSIGIGGHVGPEDGAPGDPELLIRALQRELREELFLPSEIPTPRFLGLINDDSNPVGSVHVGLAFELQLAPTQAVTNPQDLCEVRETSVLAGGFRRLVGSEDLWQDLAEFESWSQHLLAAWSVPCHRTFENHTNDPR
eukprot:jgi/Undpi1/11743/HiC_scaffold_37.g14038.m1